MLEAEGKPCPWNSHSAACQNHVLIRNMRPTEIKDVEVETYLKSAAERRSYIQTYPVISAGAQQQYHHDFGSKPDIQKVPFTADVRVTMTFWDMTQTQQDETQDSGERLSCWYELDIA